MAISKEELLYIKNKYKNLEVFDRGKNEYELAGKLYLNESYNDFKVVDQFVISIIITKNYPYEIPKVYELSNKITRSYHHLYSDRELCLGIEGEIMFNCKGKLTVEYLINKYIKPYFYSYKYYERFEEMPFGERSHGIKGILEAYMEIFNVDNVIDAYYCLLQVVKVPYRGHLPCVCGSGLKTRKCHPLTKSILDLIENNNAVIDVVKHDLKIINAVLKNKCN